VPVSDDTDDIPERARPGVESERYRLLASALAGRPVEVAPHREGEAPFTDGATIFVSPDPAAGWPGTRAEVAAQAALLGGHSLDRPILKRLSGHPRVTSRYLALESCRLAAGGGLPPGVRIPTPEGIPVTRSPEESLETALGDPTVPDPPPEWGTIRPRRVLRRDRGDDGGVPTRQDLRRSPRDDDLPDLDESEETQDPGRVAEKFSAPVGGRGPVARLLHKVLGLGREEGSGPAGAELPTGKGRAVARRGKHAVVSLVPVDPTVAEQPLVPGHAVYPEWNAHKRRYRPGWCTVVEVEPPHDRPPRDLGSASDDVLRRRLARLGVGLQRNRRRPQGDDLDLDAVVDRQVELAVGHAAARDVDVPQEIDEDVYLENLRTRRDLSVLVLLDISGSGAERSPAGRSVHDHQRAAAARLLDALASLGDRVAAYGFRSRGRSAVHMVRVKTFDDHYGAETLRRLAVLEPGSYTRLGAAVRHGSHLLETHGGTEQRLLVVLSDGFAYDDEYEGTYGEADARRALAEARRNGIGCLCLSIGGRTDAAALQRVFGTSAHARAPDFDMIRGDLGRLFRQAIRSADQRREKRCGSW